MTGILRRVHETDGLWSEALYSPCEAYRYGLRRVWGPGGEVLFVMLNPSTATELRNDPTIERCERRARAMGFGGLRITNLFAWRATDPRDLKQAAEPVGPENDALVCRWHAEAEMTLAAWGVHGAYLDRDVAVRDLLAGPVHHLGLTKQGHPRHPLYVSYATGPMVWDT